MKKFSHKFVEVLSVGLASLPLSWQLAIGDVIGVIWFDILRIRRNVAISNTEIAFPDWPYERRVTIARKSVQNLARSFVDFLRIPALASQSDVREKWSRHFRVEGLEHLEKALAKGKGVFLLTAHIGSVDWGAVGLVLSGYKMHVISKEFKWGALNRFWFETRMSLGLQFVADRGSSLTILKQLKKNEIVIFMLDQFMGPPIGIKTQFFGKETGTPLGLALLAGRSGAAVVPTHTYRNKDGSTSVVLEPEIPFVENPNKEETHLHMTQKYCDHIEGWVRQHPEQWMWVHRRWKRYKY
jgi:Kdo2-lipid IVA lauroyltransferase/acyltransferase